MPNVLQRHAWLLPLAFAALLGATSFLAFRNLERAVMHELEANLVTLRDASATAVTIWAEEKRSQVEVLAADEELREAALELLRVASEHPEPRDALLSSPAQARLADLLRLPLERIGAVGYGVVTPSGVFAGTQRVERIGLPDPSLLEVLLPMLEGKTVMTRPLGRLDLGMIAGTGLRDEAGRVVGVFGIRVQPDKEFGRILAVARAGESGETYVFDGRGRLLSPSRFEDELRAIGLLEEDQSSVLNIQIRDPGGDMTAGFVPEKSLAARPLTEAAASALAGESGVNAKGFRDYRGAEVVGAWTWLPDLEIGLTSEIDRAEAYDPVRAVRRTLLLVMGLLVLGALGMFVYSFLAQRLRKQVDEARQLGRYRIESRIGKGGMGTVYLARHALLRRPTAIKVLNTERAGKEGVARFEREVQTTSALRHPNTIEIYDYGYTPDGTFYYAMEYLEGNTLSEIVGHDGPMPESRVLNILRQASGSIAEAHEAGLIHRDIKPANLMLCERGGLYDFVKVLDFGLVREQAQSQDAALTDVSSLTGTPLFMPPEAVRAPDSLDARGDVYQLGLVGYYLLTGLHPFTADSPMDVMLKHVHETPVPPSEALGKAVSPELEKLLLECLAKGPDERPEHAGALLHRLEECAVESRWSQSDARAWWATWRQRIASWSAEEGTESSSGTLPSGIELAERTPVS